MKKNVLLSSLILLSILVCGFGCYYNREALLKSEIKTEVDPLQNKFNLTTAIRATVALSNIDEEGDQVFYCGGVFVGP